MSYRNVIIAICGLLAMASCGNLPRDARQVDSLPPVFPDYIGVTIPVGIAPMNFNVVSEGVSTVDVVVKGSRGGELHCNGEWARFDADDWHELVARNKGGELTFTVCAEANGQWVRYADFKMFVSAMELGEWGLTYRRIAPGYELYSRMGIYQRELGSFDETEIIGNEDAYGMCCNCHAANQTDPAQFVFHVRGDHGATIIQQKGNLELLKARNDELGGSMVYPYWHPSGQYCAFSTNQTWQRFHVGGEKRIEVFDLASDVFVYNPGTHEIITDSLLTTDDWSENCPTFSPDGRWLYYITCRQQSYPQDFKQERYNLCRISFNPDDATFGERADTLFDAASMGKSLTWPKPSYDGRFLMFTLIDYGYFSIWHKEAEQWLLDLRSGEARKMDEVNSDDADSYHNWSANSRWFVFTSRRNDGLYSQLFLASIDDEGRATKPFLLPQENPQEYYGQTLFSFNTPDFTRSKVEMDKRKVIGEILGDRRTETNVARGKMRGKRNKSLE